MPSTTAQSPVPARGARRKQLWAAAAAALLVLATGCGSTVQVHGTVAGDGDTSGALDGVPGASGGAPISSTSGQQANLGGSGVQVPGAVGTTGTTGGSGTGTASSSGVVAQPSGKGPANSGPAPTGPLKFGILAVASTNAATGAIGASAQTSTSGEDLAKAFVNYYNAHGGMAGRKLEPVTYTINASDNNYDTSTAAACARFTQDNHVPFVLTQLGNLWSANYESCLTKAGVTDFNLALGIPDRTGLGAYPNFYSMATATVDRRMTAVFKGLSSSGFISPKSKIGLIVENCAENTKAYTNTVAPLVKSLGLNVQKREVSCLRGFSQAASWISEVQATVLPFRSAGVDRVMFVSAWESLGVFAFEGQASTQGFQPAYGLSSNAGSAANAGMYSAAQNARMHGIGWLPIFDTTGIPQNASTRKCLAMARSQGVSVASQTDHALVDQVCEQFLILERVLTNSGGRDDRASLRNGFAAVSRGFLSAMQIGGQIALSDTQHDATKLFAQFDYGSSCKCFRYSTAPKALA